MNREKIAKMMFALYAVISPLLYHTKYNNFYVLIFIVLYTTTALYFYLIEKKINTKIKLEVMGIILLGLDLIIFSIFRSVIVRLIMVSLILGVILVSLFFPKAELKNKK